MFGWGAAETIVLMRYEYSVAGSRQGGAGVSPLARVGVRDAPWSVQPAA